MAKSVVPTSAAEQLRAAGVKVTPARLRVLEAISEVDRPLRHAELEAQLATINRVTLYRVLDSLVSCGLAFKLADDRGVFRFATVAARRQHASHAHFRCVDCGAVFCLNTPPPPPPRLPRGFRLAEVELDLRGTCVDCARRGDGR